MFVELNENNYFVQYHENKDTVSPEHMNFTIEITEELYDALQNKMPWKLDAPDYNKVYVVSDLALFQDIVIVQTPTEQDRLSAVEDAISALMGV